MRSFSPNGPWRVPRARPFAHAANARHPTHRHYAARATRAPVPDPGLIPRTYSCQRRTTDKELGHESGDHDGARHGREHHKRRRHRRAAARSGPGGHRCRLCGRQLHRRHGPQGRSGLRLRLAVRPGPRGRRHHPLGGQRRARSARRRARRGVHARRWHGRGRDRRSRRDRRSPAGRAARDRSLGAPGRVHGPAPADRTGPHPPRRVGPHALGQRRNRLCGQPGRRRARQRPADRHGRTARQDPGRAGSRMGRRVRAGRPASPRLSDRLLPRAWT